MDPTTLTALIIERLAFSHDPDGHPSAQAVADAFAIAMQAGQGQPAAFAHDDDPHRFAFVEADHPRGKKGTADGGQFVEKRAPAVRGKMVAAKRVGKGKDAKIVLSGGKRAPARIKASMVPPDWSDVKVSTDPSAEVLVTARDSKGRPKTVYTDDYLMRNAALKFARVEEMLRKGKEIGDEIQRDRKGDKKEEAECAWLMQVQATRPGSEADTGAREKAYGATTLRAEHVVKAKDGVRLQFVGKEGVWHDHLVRDPTLAKMLLERKASAGKRGGKLFDTTDARVSAYTKKLDGGHFSPKDFRTKRANELALAEIKRLGPPKSEKEFRERIKAVAEHVSGVLGNRPQQALESYINPAVFSGWRVHSGDTARP